MLETLKMLPRIAIIENSSETAEVQVAFYGWEDFTPGGPISKGWT